MDTETLKKFADEYIRKRTANGILLPEIRKRVVEKAKATLSNRDICKQLLLTTKNERKIKVYEVQIEKLNLGLTRYNYILSTI